MPRLSDASRLKRRDDIAAAAMRCFARDGFAATTMADIIREAGSSAGSVYSNFESKADLVRYAASSALRTLTATVTDEPPSERTPTSVLTHLLESSSDRTHAQTLLQIWAEVPRDPAMAAVGRSSVLELRSLIRAALVPWGRDPAHRRTSTPESTAESLADAMLAIVQGYLVRITIDYDIDPRILANTLVAESTRF